MSPARTLVALHARLVRRSTLVLAVLFGAAAAAVTAGYEGLYPPGTDRSAAVHLGQNPGFRAILGSGAGLDTPGGFVAWRFGGPAVVILAVWASLATTRLLRGEEDAGRSELIRAGAVTARTVVRSVTAVISAANVTLAAGITAGLVVTGVPLDGAALTAAAVATAGFTFAAFGIVAAEALPTRRAAALTSGGVVAAAYLVRAIANVRAGWAWLRWATPLGWAELVRPFGDRTVAPLVVATATTAALATLGGVLARRRDLGRSPIADRSTRRPRTTGLTTSLGFTARHGLGRAVVWLVPLIVLSVTFALLSRDVGDFFRSNETFAELFARFGIDPAVPVRAFLGFVASTFAIAPVCFAVAELAAAREEEATGRLDHLLTRTVTRRAWILGHLAVTLAGVATLAVGLAAGTGVGATWAGAGIDIGEFATVALNTIPVAVLFLGVTGLLFAAAPRLTSALGFGLVGVTFLWQILGSAIQAPQWTLDLTPFTHVAPVPAQGMNVGGALTLTLVGAASAALAVEIFTRRDIQES